jgi:hypothetical protein
MANIPPSELLHSSAGLKHCMFILQQDMRPYAFRSLPGASGTDLVWCPVMAFTPDVNMMHTMVPPIKLITAVPEALHE